jgi:hypothetical protein
MLAACAPRVAPLPVSVPADPAAVLALVRQREDAIHTLRARFSATVYHGDSVRRAEGVLLVKKPDRFRLRLLSPFGFTVFDYVAHGAHALMQLPLEGQQLADDEIGAQSPFSPLDFRQAFLRGAAAFPGRCTPAAAGAEVVVDCRDERGVRLREIRIARATATVIGETSFADAQPRLVLQFGDFRAVGGAGAGLALPFAVELRAPQRQVTMQIAVHADEINPLLADALFDAADAIGSGR